MQEISQQHKEVLLIAQTVSNVVPIQKADISGSNFIAVCYNYESFIHLFENRKSCDPYSLQLLQGQQTALRVK